MVYARHIAAAQRMIQAYGGLVTYRASIFSGPVDADKPWREKTDASADHSVRAAFFPFETMTQYTKRMQEGTQGGEQAVLIAAADLAVTPNAGDLIQRDGETTWWKVLGVDTLNVNGEAILHTIKVGT